MNRQELTAEFLKNHLAFIEYIASLTDEEFVHRSNDKWTPGQQLDHVLKCIRPLAQILSSKPVIESKFGRTERACMSRDAVLGMYTLALKNGGKAPERFVPDKIELSKRTEIKRKLSDSLNLLAKSMENYSEEELDSLIIPHPLLGNLAIREMLHLMSFHVIHHQEKTKQNLK